MPILQAADIADLVLSTLNDLGRGKWTDIASSLQRHVAMTQLLQKHKVGFSGGKGIQWNLMVKNGGHARQTGLFQTDNVNVVNVMKQAEAPWRHTETSYAFDIREFLMNQSEEAIFDLIKTRRASAWISLAEHLEDQFWRTPAGASDENLWGVNYWVVYNSAATAGQFAFTSALPSGISNIAGLDPATFSRWRNGSAKYSSIDNTNAATNLITLWREAAVKCDFKSLPMAAIPQYSVGMQMGYYTNYSVLQKLEFSLTQQNDNLGNDVASKDGAVVFRRVPVEYVPFLDTCNQNPVYGIDWSALQPVFLEGNYLRETHKKEADNQHNVTNHFVDLTMNLRCTDRRKQFVLSDGGSAMSFTFSPTTGD
jgi:hypothetical protein